MMHNQRTSMYKHSWAISMVTLLSHRCWKSKSLPKQHAGRCLIPAFALFLLSTALLWLLFYWIVLYSTCCEWEMCVASAEGHSPTSDTLGRARALNTTLVLCHIPFSCCDPWDVECGYRLLQHAWAAVKGKYSCGSLVMSTPRKTLGCFSDDTV